MRQTLKDVSNKYESVFFILTGAISFCKLGVVHGQVHGVVHGPGPWGGPWTGSMRWSMDRVPGVLHGPRSMFCIRPHQFGESQPA